MAIRIQKRLIIVLTVYIDKIPAYSLKLGCGYRAVIKLYKPLAACGKPPVYNYVAVFVGRNAAFGKQTERFFVKTAENRRNLCRIAPRTDKLLRRALAQNRVYCVYNYRLTCARFTRKHVKALGKFYIGTLDNRYVLNMKKFKHFFSSVIL